MHCGYCRDRVMPDGCDRLSGILLSSFIRTIPSVTESHRIMPFGLRTLPPVGSCPPASKIAIFCLISLELVGRVSGEVSDNAVGIIQIEHLKDGVGSLAVLTFHDGVLDAHFLGSHVVLKHSLAVQADPCILRA